MLIKCQISLGELVDKISILRIKKKFIKDKELLEHVEFEDKVLTEQLTQLQLTNINDYLLKLIEINTRLWQIEDEIREKEKKQDFHAEFISLARSVYKTNDERFRIKNSINQLFGSLVKEVKSYKEY
ncbi:MAG: hypothetical protein A2202_02445 [Bdellovibrionales bacterium RIFOXYA1_FULL_36_14]|nr:MAG: hypothetical protein A2202_02445 [Bdellovibrionales bacterium RIFOXYA1_FULL_36_14]